MNPATDPLTAVAGALAAEDRAAVERNWSLANPRHAGAMTADILDMLYSHDAHLDEMEPFFSANEDLTGCDGAQFAALALIRLHRPVTRAAVMILLIRAGLNPPASPPDLAAFAARLTAIEAEADELAAYAGRDADLADLADDFHLLAADLAALAAGTRRAAQRGGTGASR